VNPVNSSGVLRFRRFSSTFPGGWPGIGLLLMRLVAGLTLLDHGITGWQGEPPLQRVLVCVLAGGAGMQLLAGLWTPLAGALALVGELWCAWSQPEYLLTHILVATLSVGLALVGPGAWSVDSRLFGWKRIDIRNHKSWP
jgi:putative oxidoreductase